MTTYSFNSGKGVTLRIDYSDVAGAFGGWFLLVVNGDNLETDADSNPANGPSSFNPLSQTVIWMQPSTLGSGQWYPGSPASAAPYSGSGVTSPFYRERMLQLVHARLDRMFGEGHSATWTATVIQGVTPAVVDDNW